MPIYDTNQTMRTPRYGAIGVSPVPVPGAMPGQVPSGFPQNMGVVQQPGQMSANNTLVPDSIVSAKPPIVAPDQASAPLQVQNQNNGQSANQKMYNKNNSVLDKNQMSGAINRRFKQNA